MRLQPFASEKRWRYPSTEKPLDGRGWRSALSAALSDAVLLRPAPNFRCVVGTRPSAGTM